MRTLKLNTLDELKALDPEQSASLRSLDLTDYNFTKSNPWELIGKLDSLEVLDLSNNPSLHDLSGLKRVPQLVELDISGTNITDLSPIGQLTSLQRFYAYDTDIDGLSPLSNLLLRIIEMGRSSVSDLTPLAEIKTLEEAIFQGNENLHSLSGLEQLEALKKLDVKATGIQDPNEFSKLENLCNLTELEVNVEIEFAKRATLDAIDRNRKNQQPVLNQGIFSDDRIQQPKGGALKGCSDTNVLMMPKWEALGSN